MNFGGHFTGIKSPPKFKFHIRNIIVCIRNIIVRICNIIVHIRNIIPGVPKKTIHCLISYNVKPIKAISIK